MPGLSGSPKITAWSDALPIFHLTSLGGVKVMWLGSGTSAATAPVAAMTAHAAIAKPKRRIESLPFARDKLKAEPRRKRRLRAIRPGYLPSTVKPSFSNTAFALAEER